MSNSRPGDTIEQAVCRERTEEEDRAVEISRVLRAMIFSADQEVRIYTSNKPLSDN